MTPGARLQAAIEILDSIGPDRPAEQALTNWARGARFAGSGDRAAVRDHVFDVLRQRRSVAALGGGETGRQSILGLLRARQVDPDTLFTGQGHAPAPLSDAERQAGRAPEGAEAMDLPDWLAARIIADLGPQAADYATALTRRAPVFLRVNRRRCNLPQAIAALKDDGIAAIPHALAGQALEVVENARRVAQSQPYRDGWVELQDVASQAVVDLLPLRAGARVLDYCAGGGGKTLAIAARHDGTIVAHDANPRRLRDLPVRAARAGVDIAIAEVPTGRFDLVLCDVPCSGSGAWRRSPEGKWVLTPQKLAQTEQVQAQILHEAAGLVAPGGCLAYVTCSVLASENSDRIAAFLADHPGWTPHLSRQFLPEDGGDGFFISCLLQS